MVDFIECEEKTTEPITHEKIKAFNPQIVVSDHPDKPYYNINYYDIAKKEWYIGYGSYYLKNVYKWLFECFEEVDSDMVEVVRCKDCKHFDEFTSKCYVFCDNGCEVQLEVDSDHFCSYGERRTDEN